MCIHAALGRAGGGWKKLLSFTLYFLYLFCTSAHSSVYHCAPGWSASHLSTGIWHPEDDEPRWALLLLYPICSACSASTFVSTIVRELISPRSFGAAGSVPHTPHTPHTASSATDRSVTDRSFTDRSVTDRDTLSSRQTMSEKDSRVYTFFSFCIFFLAWHANALNQAWRVYVVSTMNRLHSFHSGLNMFECHWSFCSLFLIYRTHLHIEGERLRSVWSFAERQTFCKFNWIWTLKKVLSTPQKFEQYLPDGSDQRVNSQRFRGRQARPRFPSSSAWGDSTVPTGPCPLRFVFVWSRVEWFTRCDSVQ